MTLLIVGLLLFLGVHSVRVFADDFRSAQIARLGANAWKGLYTLASIAGFALLIWGFGLARQQPIVLWEPWPVLRLLAAPLTLVAFVFFAAAYVPGNSIKARLQHPMVLGVKVWAFAHLLVTRTLAELVLFGAFLVWAVLCFRAARARDRAAGTAAGTGSLAATGASVAIGAAAWAAFAFWGHGALIGLRPFG